MSDDIQNLVRPDLKHFKPYESARSLFTDADVYLDANECSFLAGGNAHRYPEPQPEVLRQRLSDLYNVSIDSIFMGRGTSEAIDSLVRVFCDARRDKILVCPPTFCLYEVYAELQGCEVIRIPLKRDEGFSLNVDEILTVNDESLKLLFLCSPNNPTGSAILTEDVERICRAYEGRALVVLDEAYIEFSEEDGSNSLLRKYKNLVIMRTLSKAWGVAAARFGVALADPAIIHWMRAALAAYPLSTPAVDVVMKTITPEGKRRMQSRVNAVKEERAWLARELERCELIKRVYPSEANFLLVKTDDATDVYETCRSQGILIRNQNSAFGLEGCLRITVGTREENKRLLEVLA